MLPVVDTNQRGQASLFLVLRRLRCVKGPFSENLSMPRPPRADEAGGLYHALNRGNLRATIFHKDADYA
ncbi:hypothetical protein Pla52n_44630 [Stieleria varia]|uniref:Uncharacterized protein n=1 Tax=Stieleria varia TaxID=2528005 RepID=A0A5C6ANT2_9BACT|nr:hypothetical protein Pla52n_44630 [Stieleria varia]